MRSQIIVTAHNLSRSKQQEKKLIQEIQEMYSFLLVIKSLTGKKDKSKFLKVL